MRKAKLHRKTAETEIRIALTYRRSREVRGLHRNSFSRPHVGALYTPWRIRSETRSTGDLDVDQHHTVEDVGIALGEVFDQALGDRRGILRAGYFVMPMDETLGLAAVDFGGRAAAVVDTKVHAARVGDLQVELVPDFFEGFARGARANVHARVLYGRSSHHKIEALFKAFARALRVACSRDRRLGRMLPSTKGLL